MAEKSRKAKGAAASSAKKPSAASRSAAGKANEAGSVREAIAAMPAADRALAERVHAVVTAAAPTLEPRLWYGMPAYAKDGKVICFFQSAAKFKTRYATFGFQHAAALDGGPLWPVAFALQALTPEAAETIAALVKKAVG